MQAGVTADRGAQVGEPASAPTGGQEFRPAGLKPASLEQHDRVAMSEDGEPSLPSHRGHVIYVKAQVRAFARSIAVGKSNVVQEANTESRRMALYPGRDDWELARQHAGLTSTAHDDMHAGEIETSLLLHVCPDLVRAGFEDADHLSERPQLLVLGMRGYTNSGVIGMPSQATAAKGAAVLASLTESFDRTLNVLRNRPHS